MEITQYAYARPVESNRSSTTNINKDQFLLRPQQLGALSSIVYKPRSFTIERLKPFTYLQTQHNSQIIESQGNTWMNLPKSWAEVSCQKSPLVFPGHALKKMINRISNRPGARFPKVPKTFPTRKAICKTPTRLFCKGGLSQVEKGIKIKITAKFRATRCLRFEDTKRIMSPELCRLKSFGTFKKPPQTTFFCFRWPDLTGNATQESQKPFFCFTDGK